MQVQNPIGIGQCKFCILTHILCTGWVDWSIYVPVLIFALFDNSLYMIELHLLKPFSVYTYILELNHAILCFTTEIGTGQHILYFKYSKHAVSTDHPTESCCYSDEATYMKKATYNDRLNNNN